MKKILILSLVAIFVFSFISCNDKPVKPEEALLSGVDESMFSTVWISEEIEGNSLLIIFDEEGHPSFSIKSYEEYEDEEGEVIGYYYYYIDPVFDDIDIGTELQLMQLQEEGEAFLEDTFFVKRIEKPNTSSSRYIFSSDSCDIYFFAKFNKTDDTHLTLSSDIVLRAGSLIQPMDYVEYDLLSLYSLVDEEFTKIELPDFTYGQIDYPATTIIEETDYNRADIKEVIIPEGFTTVAEDGLVYFPYVSTIRFPNSMTTLDYYSVFFLGRLSSIDIPASINYIGEGCFTACPLLTEINVAEDNAYYKSVDGVLYSKDGKTLLLYPEGKGPTYTVEEGTTTIGSTAFEVNFTIEEVNLPASITTIEEDAFFMTRDLKTINYDGTKEQWESISKEGEWFFYCSFTVKCSDGQEIHYESEFEEL